MQGEQYFMQEVLLERVLNDLRSWTGEDFSTVIAYLEKQLGVLAGVDFPPHIETQLHQLLETIEQLKLQHRTSSIEVTSRHNLIMLQLRQLRTLLADPAVS